MSFCITPSSVSSLGECAIRIYGVRSHIRQVRRGRDVIPPEPCVLIQGHAHHSHDRGIIRGVVTPADNPPAVLVVAGVRVPALGVGIGVAIDGVDHAAGVVGGVVSLGDLEAVSAAVRVGVANSSKIFHGPCYAGNYSSLELRWVREYGASEGCECEDCLCNHFFFLVM